MKNRWLCVALALVLLLVQAAGTLPESRAYAAPSVSSLEELLDLYVYVIQACADGSLDYYSLPETAGISSLVGQDAFWAGESGWDPLEELGFAVIGDDDIMLIVGNTSDYEGEVYDVWLVRGGVPRLLLQATEEDRYYLDGVHGTVRRESVYGSQEYYWDEEFSLMPIDEDDPMLCIPDWIGYSSFAEYGTPDGGGMGYGESAELQPYTGDIPAAYRSLLESYRAAAAMGTNNGSLANTEWDWMYNYFYGGYGVGGLENVVGFALFDLDRDGTPELLLGTTDRDDVIGERLMQVYTIVEGRPKLLLEDGFWETLWMELTLDGLLQVELAVPPDTDSRTVAYYRVDHGNLVFVEGYAELGYGFDEVSPLYYLLQNAQQAQSGNFSQAPLTDGTDVSNMIYRHLGYSIVSPYIQPLSQTSGRAYGTDVSEPEPGPGPKPVASPVTVTDLTIDHSAGEENGILLILPEMVTIRWQMSEPGVECRLILQDAYGTVVYQNEGTTDTSVALNAQQLQAFEIYSFSVTPVTDGVVYGKGIQLQVVDQEYLNTVLNVSVPTITVPSAICLPPDRYLVHPGEVTLCWHADGPVDHYTLRITGRDGAEAVSPRDLTEETTSLVIPDTGSEQRFTVSVTAVPESPYASSTTASLTLRVLPESDQLQVTGIQLNGSEVSSMDVLFIGDQVTYTLSMGSAIRGVTGDLTYRGPDGETREEETLAATYDGEHNAYVSFSAEAEGTYSITFHAVNTDGEGTTGTDYKRTFLAVKPVTPGFDVFRCSDTGRIFLKSPVSRELLDITIDEQSLMWVIGEYGRYYYVEYNDGVQITRAFVSMANVRVYDREVKKRAFIIAGASLGYYSADGGGKEDLLNFGANWFDQALTGQLFTDAGSAIVVSDNKTTNSALIMDLSLAATLADANDITYIYIACHGAEYGAIEMANGERLPTDDLCAMIGKIPGRVNLFIDSCYTGGYVVSYAEDHEWDEKRYCIITTGGYAVTRPLQGGTRWFNIAYDALSIVHRVANQNRMTLGYFYERTKTICVIRNEDPYGHLVGFLVELCSLDNPPLHYGNDENILFDFNK